MPWYSVKVYVKLHLYLYLCIERQFRRTHCQLEVRRISETFLFWNFIMFPSSLRFFIDVFVVVETFFWALCCDLSFLKWAASRTVSCLVQWDEAST